MQKTGSYSACVATVKSSSPDLASQLYAARSLIALSQTDEAADWLSSLDQESPGVKAVTLLNEALATGEPVAEEVRDLLQESTEGVVRAVSGVLLAIEGETAEAMQVWQDGIEAQDQEWCVDRILIELMEAQTRTVSRWRSSSGSSSTASTRPRKSTSTQSPGWKTRSSPNSAKPG